MYANINQIPQQEIYQASIASNTVDTKHTLEEVSNKTRKTPESESRILINAKNLESSIGSKVIKIGNESYKTIIKRLKNGEIAFSVQSINSKDLTKNTDDVSITLTLRKVNNENYIIHSQNMKVKTDMDGFVNHMPESEMLLMLEDCNIKSRLEYVNRVNTTPSKKRDFKNDFAPYLLPIKTTPNIPVKTR
jgi:hypothetical protein